MLDKSKINLYNNKMGIRKNIERKEKKYDKKISKFC